VLATPPQKKQRAHRLLGLLHAALKSDHVSAAACGFGVGRWVRLEVRRPDVYHNNTCDLVRPPPRSRQGRESCSRIFSRIVRSAFGPGHRVTPHMLRHTFASLHIARGTNLKWIQETGGWASAKMLVDVYGRFMPTESEGYADAITTSNGTTA
jgi:integrase